MSEQATIAAQQRAVSPLPQPGVQQTLITAGTTLTQDFNDAISDIVSVEQARRLTLLVDYAAHASATDGYVVLLAMGANTRTAPALGDDDWYALPWFDTSESDADIAGGATLPTGADYTAGPNWRSIKCGGLLVETMRASSSEEVRQRVPLGVDDVRWVYVAAIQQGDTTNFGTLGVKYALSL